MNYHYRRAEYRVEQLAEMFPVVVVSGARQVGKSTLLRHMLKDRAKVFTFDPVDDLYGARADPDFFLDQNEPPLILDEIQYATPLLPAIKRRVDLQPDRKGLYYLSGSQNLAVLKDVAESMAGRAGVLELPAMTIAEWSLADCGDRAEGWLQKWLRGLPYFSADMPGRIPDPFPVTRRIWTGTMPKLIDQSQVEKVPEYLRSYVLTYIERDVRRAGDIEDLDIFRRFVGLVAALTGQEINFAELGRDLGITRATAKKWLGLLQATYQWISTPPYHGNTVKRVSGHPKGYIHDTGLASFFLRLSSPEAVQTSPALGSLFETLAVTGILKEIATMGTQPASYHWRTHAGAEVDLVLELDGKLWPFECKAGTRINKHDASGIRAFRNTYPNLTDTPGAILAPVEAPYALTDDIWVLPYDLA